MSIQQALTSTVRRSAAGSQVFTASGSFTVPVYTSLTVVAEGGSGATGPAGNTASDPGLGDCGGGSGGAGGIGGKATKVYTFGLVVGSSITVSIVSGTVTFNSSITANKGATGGAGGDGNWRSSGGDYYCETGGNGSPGANGTATGGDTNVTGGSTNSAGKLTITWS